uniref:Uncharacterized protein n=1 Tax=Xenopus tropicalis TaxID=8364 RepID=A0A7D9N0I5_XENTR
MDNEHKLKDGKPQSLTDSLLEDIKNSNCYTEDLNSNALQGSAIVSDEVFGTEGTQEDNKEPSHERTDDAREASESDTKKDLPRKNRKPGSRLPSRIQKESANRTSNSECHSSAPDLDNVPLPKSSYNFDPSHFDDPDFNPFGGKATLPPSPTLPKGSYKFDEETGDELTPSKSSSGLSESDSRIESGSANSSPKASRSRLITENEDLEHSGCFKKSSWRQYLDNNTQLKNVHFTRKQISGKLMAHLEFQTTGHTFPQCLAQPYQAHACFAMCPRVSLEHILGHTFLLL